MGTLLSRNTGVIAAMLALCSAGAFAQPASPGAARTYPVKPIRLIVPFPAGASSDIVGRLLAQKISEPLGEQVVADNRAGAGGNLGIALAAKAAPDGYTMVIATASIAVSPSLYSNPSCIRRFRRKPCGSSLSWRAGIPANSISARAAPARPTILPTSC